MPDTYIEEVEVEEIKITSKGREIVKKKVPAEKTANLSWGLPLVILFVMFVVCVMYTLSNYEDYNNYNSLIGYRQRDIAKPITITWCCCCLSDIFLTIYQMYISLINVHS